MLIGISLLFSRGKKIIKNINLSKKESVYLFLNEKTYVELYAHNYVGNKFHICKKEFLVYLPHSNIDVFFANNKHKSKIRHVFLYN